MRQPGQPPSNLSNRQRKLLTGALAELGYRSYRDYLNGSEWAEAKGRYRASGKLQSCLVCRAPNVDLHHRTYGRLGAERLDDLVALCREHHEQLHDEGLDLWNGPTLLYRREQKLRRNRRSPPQPLRARDRGRARARLQLDGFVS